MNIAIITGASSGLGKYLAFEVLNNEKNIDKVWLIARRADLMQKLYSAYANKVEVIAADLTKEDELLKIKEKLQEEKPVVKLLINAAGFGRIDKVYNIGYETTLKMINLNCKALVAMTTMSLPYLKSGSRIIQISSASAFLSVENLSVYAASKAFVNSYSKSLQMELKDRNIKVTAVCPYWLKDTEFIDNASSKGTNNGKLKKGRFAQSARKAAGKILKKSKTDSVIYCYGFMPKVLLVTTRLVPDTAINYFWKKIDNN